MYDSYSVMAWSTLSLKALASYKFYALMLEMVVNSATTLKKISIDAYL